MSSPELDYPRHRSVQDASTGTRRGGELRRPSTRSATGSRPNGVGIALRFVDLWRSDRRPHRPRRGTTSPATSPTGSPSTARARRCSPTPSGRTPSWLTAVTKRHRGSGLVAPPTTSGTAPGGGNLISGNSQPGILVVGPRTPPAPRSWGTRSGRTPSATPWRPERDRHPAWRDSSSDTQIGGTTGVALSRRHARAPAPSSPGTAPGAFTSHGPVVEHPSSKGNHIGVDINGTQGLGNGTRDRRRRRLHRRFRIGSSTSTSNGGNVISRHQDGIRHRPRRPPRPEAYRNKIGTTSEGNGAVGISIVPASACPRRARPPSAMRAATAT